MNFLVEFMIRIKRPFSSVSLLIAFLGRQNRGWNRWNSSFVTLFRAFSLPFSTYGSLCLLTRTLIIFYTFNVALSSQLRCGEEDFWVFVQIRGKSKKSVSWSRPHREVRFFAWRSACLKYHISSIFKCCKILTIFAVFCGKFWSEKFSSFLKMDQNWFYLIKQASDMSKIKLSFIIYAGFLNKTTKTTNNLTNEQPSSHFFPTDPLCKNTLALLSAF